jgi:hypothetical protein
MTGQTVDSDALYEHLQHRLHIMLPFTTKLSVHNDGRSIANNVLAKGLRENSIHIAGYAIYLLSL